MTPPIRRGDGTPLAPSGIAQVRAGDGDVYYQRNVIPDSLVLQYTGGTFTTGDSTWSDDEATSDMSLSGDPQSDTLSDGADSVNFDNDGDYGAFSFPSALTGSSFQTVSFEWAFQTTDSTGFLGLIDDTDASLTIRIDSDVEVRLVDESGDVLRFNSTSGPTLNDGSRHDLTVAMDGPNNDATVIIDGSSVSLSFSDQQSPSNYNLWNADMHHAIRRRNDIGGTDNDASLNTGAIRWHDEQITSQTISGYPF